MAVVRHSKCGKTWSGLRTQHCPVCCETFTSTASGDMHRVGKHGLFEGPDQRRCYTPEEMTAKGMLRNRLGYWTTGQFWLTATQEES